jgi:hypothetical protein
MGPAASVSPSPFTGIPDTTKPIRSQEQNRVALLIRDNLRGIAGAAALDAADTVRRENAAAAAKQLDKKQLGVASDCN